MTSRNRVNGGRGMGTWHWTSLTPAGAVTSNVVYPTTGYAEGHYSTMTDTVTPNFKERIRNGEVILNPMTSYEEEIKTTPIDWKIGPHPVFGTDLQTGDRMASLYILRTRPTWYAQKVADIKTESLQRAYSRVSNEDFMALVSVAEAVKTAKMLSSPFAEARRLIMAIAERKVRYGRKGLTALAAASQAWLELRLGFKPLMYDLAGIMDAYTYRGEAQTDKVRKVASAKGQVEWNIDETYSNIGIIAAAGLHQSDIRSGVVYDLQDENLTAATANRLAITPAHLAEVVWELIPCSLVVDRFIRVGDWLKAISPIPGITIHGNFTVERRVVVELHTAANFDYYVASPPATMYPRSGGTWQIYAKTVERTVNTPLVLPAVNTQVLSIQQSLDHLALINTALLGLGLHKPSKTNAAIPF